MAETRSEEESYEARLAEHDRISKEEWDNRIRQEQQGLEEEQRQQMPFLPGVRRAQPGEPGEPRAARKPRTSSVRNAVNANRYVALARECGLFLFLLVFAPRIAQSLPFVSPEGHVWLRLPYWLVLALALLPLVFFIVRLRQLQNRPWLRFALFCLPLETYFTLRYARYTPLLLVLLLALAIGIVVLLRSMQQESRRKLNEAELKDTITAIDEEKMMGAPRFRGSARRGRGAADASGHPLFRLSVTSYAWVMLLPAVLGALLGPMGPQPKPKQGPPTKELAIENAGQQEQLWQALYRLEPENWGNLTTVERQEAFQAVLDAEARHLNLPELPFKELRGFPDYQGYTLARALHSRPNQYEERLRALCCAAFTAEMAHYEKEFSLAEQEFAMCDYANLRIAQYKAFMEHETQE